MAKRRRFSISAGRRGSTRGVQVVDHDMDMNRAKPLASSIGARLAGLIRWMVPKGRLTGSPMRSVAREIEEMWPSLDH